MYRGRRRYVNGNLCTYENSARGQIKWCLFPPPSEEQSRLAARKYARVVQKLGFPAKFLDFKIQNMVGSCDVKFPIRLEGLVLTHQQFSR